MTERNIKPIDPRLKNHPMYSASDLRVLRRKGYSDDEILAFWNRDRDAGQDPVHHRVFIEFEAIELPCAAAAIQHTNADPRMDTAIVLGRNHYVMTKATAERLAANGVAFAYLHDHEMPDGTWRIITVPVNDND
jgi:hypothetical protein